MKPEPDESHPADAQVDEGVRDRDPSKLTKVLLVVFTAVVLPIVMVTLTALRSPELSKLDEPVHLDYVRRVEQGEIPRVGDLVLPETVRDVQCRTVQGRVNAPCGLPLDQYEPDMLGAGGYQYEAQQPPLYYAVTAAARQVVRLGPSDDFVLTARLTGAGWLVAGLLVFWAGARRLGLGWWPTAAVTGLMAISPGILYQAATVNNDASAVLTGASAVLVFAHLLRRPSASRAALGAAVAVGLVLLKPTGVISIAAVSAALLLDAALRRELGLRTVAAYLAPVTAGLAAYASWGVVRDRRAVVDYDVVLDALLAFKVVDHLPLHDVVANVRRLVLSYAAGTSVAPEFVTGPAQLIALALAAAAIVALWAPGWGSAAHRLGLAAMAVLVVAGPAFTLLFYLDYSIEGGPHSRYGLSLVPLLAASAAATFRTRRALVTLGLLALLLLVPTLVALIDPTTRVL